MFTVSGTCFNLPPLMNGVITYTDGLVDSRPINTIATFTCDNGYTLTGGSFRACQNDGTWSGSAPTCQCKLVIIILYSGFVQIMNRPIKFIQLRIVTLNVLQ